MITVSSNGLSIITMTSNGMALSTVPDVCLVPQPSGPPVPTPFTINSMSTMLVGGSVTVLIDGVPAANNASKFAICNGDQPGAMGGVTCGMIMGPSSFILSSFDVMLEGKPVCRLGDMMLMNQGNTVCA